MIIKGPWQSIGIFSISAITYVASSFWAHHESRNDELRLAAIHGDLTCQSIRIVSIIPMSYIASLSG
ncbi:hypothetical protein Y032_0013g2186 [Ancylostoma ceylanicum]|uniref:Uncharacterized protein n=1 Tax=Ancylostoma ceylanicum TaxID=53326 RepID=A0A016VB87_9BILA|nr:hypothetical protein Y032_0013g2186 [Ancylostoma ceylanicum]